MITELKFKFRSVKLDNRERRFHDNINFPMQTLTCKGTFSLDHLKCNVWLPFVFDLPLILSKQIFLLLIRWRWRGKGGGDQPRSDNQRLMSSSS